MKAFIAATGLIAGASAAIVARGDCCFQLTASGGASGTVGQLSDGQNRIGGGLPPATYCIKNGQITDSSGRGCILTPPTSQYQCDVGATPSPGFSISSSGEVDYNGSGVFYACPASEGVYNIYTTPVANQSKCTKITLSTGGKCAPPKPMPSMPSVAPPPPPPPPPKPTCPAQSTITVTEKAKPWTVTVTAHAVCPVIPAPSTVTISECTTSPVVPPPPPPPETTTTWEYTTRIPPANTPPPPPPPHKPSPPPEQPPPPPPPVSQPSSISTPVVVPPPPPPTKPTGSSCPTSLVGPYQTPHLIVPVSSKQSDHAYGTQYDATINAGSECTIFNFDVPYDYQGKSCSTIFLFPEQSQLQTSSFTLSGTGSLVFSSLTSPANQQTTWNNAPAKKAQLGSVSPVPGNSYSISTGMCAPGTTQSIEVCGTGSLSLSFFEDWNPSPIGVFITSC